MSQAKRARAHRVKAELDGLSMTDLVILTNKLRVIIPQQQSLLRAAQQEIKRLHRRRETPTE